MNPAYHKGRRFEYEVARTFKDLGCFVSRSAGSHSIWDLTVVAPDLDTLNRVLEWFQHKPRHSVEGLLGTAIEWAPGKTITLLMIQGCYQNILVLLIQCKVRHPAKRKRITKKALIGKHGISWQPWPPTKK